MAIITNLTKRVDQLEADVAELRRLVEAKSTKTSTAKPKSDD